ncbi:flagellar basal body FlgE domain-containing protein [Sphingomonas sp. MMS24-JH45]
MVASALENAISLKLPEFSSTAKPTTTVKYAANLSSNAPIPDTTPFDRFDPKSYNSSTSSTIYDTSGNALTMTRAPFVRETVGDGTNTTAGDSKWGVYTFVGDQPMKTGNGASDHGDDLRPSRCGQVGQFGDVRRFHRLGRGDAAAAGWISPTVRRRSPRPSTSAARRRTAARSACCRASTSMPTARGEGQLLERLESRRWARWCRSTSPTPPACGSSATAIGMRPACRARRRRARRRRRASAASCRA